MYLLQISQQITCRTVPSLYLARKKERTEGRSETSGNNQRKSRIFEMSVDRERDRKGPEGARQKNRLRSAVELDRGKKGRARGWCAFAGGCAKGRNASSSERSAEWSRSLSRCEHAHLLTRAMMWSGSNIPRDLRNYRNTQGTKGRPGSATFSVPPS